MDVVCDRENEEGGVSEWVFVWGVGFQKVTGSYVSAPFCARKKEKDKNKPPNTKHKTQRFVLLPFFCVLFCVVFFLSYYLLYPPLAFNKQNKTWTVELSRPFLLSNHHQLQKRMAKQESF